MTSLHAVPLSEDDLDMFVSIAIRRAEVLDEIESVCASDAWREVMAYEQRIAAMTNPDSVPGGIARVGAVRAALAAGEHHEAEQLAAIYYADQALPHERRSAIEVAFSQNDARLAKRFPALAKGVGLAEVRIWRVAANAKPHIFPLAA